MAESPVRIGLIGCGHNGVAHLECYANDDRVAVAAVCDLNEARRAAVASEWELPGYARAEDLLAAERPDLVLICTGDPFHVEPFVAACEAHCHIFVEKPLADTLDGLERMLAAAAANLDRRMMVGHVLRFNPFFQQVRQSCSDGTLGTLFYLEADYLHDLHVQADPGRFNAALGMNWYTAREQPVIGGGVHAFDLLRWFAAGDAVEVSGFANHFAFPEMQHDDCQVMLARFDNGAIAKVASCYGPVGPRPPVNNLAVYGTAGTVRGTDLWVGEGSAVDHFSLADLAITGHPFDPERDHLLAAIVDDSPLLCDVFEIANSTATCIRGAEAAALGKTLPVPQYARPGG